MVSRQNYLDLPKEDRLKILKARRSDIINFLSTTLVLTEKHTSEAKDKIQRKEDKIGHLLPILLLIPALMFSPLLATSTRIILIALMPGFALSIVFALKGLWPYPTPTGTGFFVPDPADDEAIDFFFTSMIEAEKLRWDAHHKVLKAKTDALNLVYSVTAATLGYLFLILIISSLAPSLTESFGKESLLSKAGIVSLLFLANSLTSALYRKIFFRTPPPVEMPFQEG